MKSTIGSTGHDSQSNKTTRGPTRSKHRALTKKQVQPLLRLLDNRMPILIIDADGWIVHANRMYLKLMRRSSTTYADGQRNIRQDCLDTVGINDFLHNLKEKDLQEATELVFHCSNRSIKYCSLTAARKLRAGKVQNIIFSIQDISSRKQLEIQAQLSLGSERQARAESELANQAKDNFLAMVSHELRTPLTAILGWINLIKHTKYDPDTVVTGIETLEHNAKI